MGRKSRKRNVPAGDTSNDQTRIPITSRIYLRFHTRVALKKLRAAVEEMTCETEGVRWFERKRAMFAFLAAIKQLVPVPRTIMV
jgi:hypothetical protein